MFFLKLRNQAPVLLTGIAHAAFSLLVGAMTMPAIGFVVLVIGGMVPATILGISDGSSTRSHFAKALDRIYEPFRKTALRPFLRACMDVGVQRRLQALAESVEGSTHPLPCGGELVLRRRTGQLEVSLRRGRDEFRFLLPRADEVRHGGYEFHSTLSPVELDSAGAADLAFEGALALRAAAVGRTPEYRAAPVFKTAAPPRAWLAKRTDNPVAAARSRAVELSSACSDERLAQACSRIRDAMDDLSAFSGDKEVAAALSPVLDHILPNLAGLLAAQIAMERIKRKDLLSGSAKAGREAVMATAKLLDAHLARAFSPLGRRSEESARLLVEVSRRADPLGA